MKLKPHNMLFRKMDSMNGKIDDIDRMLKEIREWLDAMRKETQEKENESS